MPPLERHDLVGVADLGHVPGSDLEAQEAARRAVVVADLDDEDQTSGAQVLCLPDDPIEVDVGQAQQGAQGKDVTRPSGNRGAAGQNAGCQRALALGLSLAWLHGACRALVGDARDRLLCAPRRASMAARGAFLNVTQHAPVVPVVRVVPVGARAPMVDEQGVVLYVRDVLVDLGDCRAGLPLPGAVRRDVPERRSSARPAVVLRGGAVALFVEAAYTRGHKHALIQRNPRLEVVPSRAPFLLLRVSVRLLALRAVRELSVVREVGVAVCVQDVAQVLRRVADGEAVEALQFEALEVLALVQDCPQDNVAEDEQLQRDGDKAKLPVLQDRDLRGVVRQGLIEVRPAQHSTKLAVEWSAEN
mmetsp:Transcript_131924/g.367801  ORF Transcript_131924/g.367801 Transcript_131924/m.367801 type:complete len:360 (+) Transcript_131924:563-1642(+)